VSLAVSLGSRGTSFHYNESQTEPERLVKEQSVSLHDIRITCLSLIKKNLFSGKIKCTERFYV
jgi:hypothetical protein